MLCTPIHVPTRTRRLAASEQRSANSRRTCRRPRQPAHVRRLPCTYAQPERQRGRAKCGILQKRPPRLAGRNSPSWQRRPATRTGYGPPRRLNAAGIRHGVLPDCETNDQWHPPYCTPSLTEEVTEVRLTSASPKAVTSRVSRNSDDVPMPNSRPAPPFTPHLLIVDSLLLSSGSNTSFPRYPASADPCPKFRNR